MAVRLYDKNSSAGDRGPRCTDLPGRCSRPPLCPHHPHPRHGLCLVHEDPVLSQRSTGEQHMGAAWHVAGAGSLALFAIRISPREPIAIETRTGRPGRRAPVRPSDRADARARIAKACVGTGRGGDPPRKPSVAHGSKAVPDWVAS
uniref:Uncharacterized protein n=1 Tax=Oryza sativa subsp. japonica TaxID=39947 RepID=Q94GS0_ORYSJ|nr:hypothetical protein [Oryza sativa Japonica Group]